MNKDIESTGVYLEALLIQNAQCISDYIRHTKGLKRIIFNNPNKHLLKKDVYYDEIKNEIIK